MTCSNVRPLLDDYADRELPSAIASEIEAHLSACRECREEFETTLSLKKILSDCLVPEPPSIYWDEVSDLVMARTVERDGITNLDNHLRQQTQERSSFYRSIASVAASLVLLATALMFSPDSSPVPSRQIWTGPAPSDQIETAATVSSVQSLLSQEEQNLIAGSMLLMGGPGMFASPTEMSAVLGLSAGR